eukprot:14872332-Alexandrium_andersonii.AAC.1
MRGLRQECLTALRPRPEHRQTWPEPAWRGRMPSNTDWRRSGQSQAGYRCDARVNKNTGRPLKKGSV